MDAVGSETTNSQRSFVGWLRAMPRWKKIALATAIVFVVVGAVWSLSSGTGTSGSTGSTRGGAPLTTNFAPGGVEAGANANAPAEEPMAKGVFRLGFSFLAGFCLGAFVRAMLRIAAIAFGFWLAMTFALSYYGLVDVDWHAIEGVWNRFTTNVGTEWGDFQRFITGSLPAAGLATTGLIVGLKKH